MGINLIVYFISMFSLYVGDSISQIFFLSSDVLAGMVHVILSTKYMLKFQAK